MALIVEDGSGVAGANSYVSLAEFRAFASLGGFTIPPDDAAAESWLWRAARKMDLFRDWKGDKANSTQGLQWPRENVYDADGELVPSTSIPRDISQGQEMLAIEMYGASLAGDTKGGGAPVAEYAVEVGEIKETTKFAVTENTGSLLGVAAYAQSTAHFAQYRKFAGLSVIRA